jgi:hypothetical protein
MCATLVSNGTLLPAGSCAPIRFACLPADPAGDIQQACRATPIRATPHQRGPNGLMVSL